MRVKTGGAMRIVKTTEDLRKSGKGRERGHLIVNFKAAVVEADEEHPGGYIEGHASIFDNVDLQNEIVKPGAFKKTLQENKEGVFLMDSHRMYDGTDAVIGRTVSLVEDAKGLNFRAFFSSTGLAQEIRQKIKEGILDKLSFGYTVMKEKIDRTTGIRELLELQLHEISVVCFPANPMAMIDSAKALGVGVVTCPDAERKFDIAMAARRVEQYVGKGEPHSRWNEEQWSSLLKFYAVVDETAPTFDDAYKGLIVDIVDGVPMIIKAAVMLAAEQYSDFKPAAEIILKRWDASEAEEKETEAAVVEEPVVVEPVVVVDATPAVTPPVEKAEPKESPIVSEAKAHLAEFIAVSTKYQRSSVVAETQRIITELRKKK